MTTTPKDADESKSVLVRRGRVEYVELYEIKDSELETFEKGSPADLQLNFSVFLLSMAFTALCTLLTATFQNHTTQTIFMVGTFGGFILGIYFMIAWWNNRTSTKALCERVKQRMPPNASGAAIKPKAEGGESVDSQPKG